MEGGTHKRPHDKNKWQVASRCKSCSCSCSFRRLFRMDYGLWPVDCGLSCRVVVPEYEAGVGSILGSISLSSSFIETTAGKVSWTWFGTNPLVGNFGGCTVLVVNISLR